MNKSVVLCVILALVGVIGYSIYKVNSGFNDARTNFINGVKKAKTIEVAIRPYNEKLDPHMTSFYNACISFAKNREIKFSLPEKVCLCTTKQLSRNELLYLQSRLNPSNPNFSFFTFLGEFTESNSNFWKLFPMLLATSKSCGCSVKDKTACELIEAYMNSATAP